MLSVKSPSKLVHTYVKFKKKLKFVGILKLLLKIIVIKLQYISCQSQGLSFIAFTKEIVSSYYD